MKRKAVALLSGGLDSRLAIKVMLEQGIELVAVNYVTVFCTCTPKNSCCSEAKKAADEFGVPLKIFNYTKQFLEIIKNPEHGYGSNLNPCIDCRISMLKNAADYMREIDASFLVTGDVLGERPMSQRRDSMRVIERDSGLEGLILRPLSAKLLEPTLPEIEGIVDREKLLNISGRSRKPQIELAVTFDMKDYPCPAGGCLLTDPEFAKRMKDLLDQVQDLTINDVKLLKVGRHFRLSPEAKIAVGRDEQENIKLNSLTRPGDWLVEAVDFAGPLTVARGEVDEDLLNTAASITVRYGKGRDNQNVKVNLWQFGNEQEIAMTIDVSSIKDEKLARLRI